jgi:ketosteroid isomerase-like protein
LNAIKEDVMSSGAKVFAAACAFSVLSAATLWAQSPEPAFLKAREERDQSIRTADAAVYNKYTTDKFIVVDQNGNVRNLADQDARFKAQAGRPPNAQAQPAAPHMEEKIDVYGDTVVLNWAQKNNQGATSRFTEVWVKENGTWKCAAAHASAVAAKP